MACEFCSSPSFLALFADRLRFLWAELQLSILFKDTPDDGVLSALGSLPQTLERTYERILKDQDAFNPPQKHKTTRKVLLWLVATARPLALQEVNDAVSEGVSRRKDLQGIIRLCGPLVRLVSQGASDHQQVSLAHFSLKEYLTSGKVLDSPSSEIHKYNVNLSDAHLHIAKVSLSYISSQELREVFNHKDDLGVIRDEFKLLDYAVLYGGTHLRPLPEADDAVIALLNDIFVPGTVSPSPHRQGKLFLELLSTLGDSRLRKHPPSIDPLYYASFFGWKLGAKRILELGPKQRETDVLNHALRAASLGGFDDVIQLLHQAGADVNAHPVSYTHL